MQISEFVELCASLIQVLDCLC